MARQIIDTGTTANDGTGDPLRTSQIKVNENFEELYSTVLFEDEVFVGRSVAASQLPSGQDNPLQVEFGPQIVTEDATLGADGTITIHKTATYLISVYLNTGRQGANGASQIYGRATINGFQVSSTILSLIDNTDINTPLQFQFTGDLPAGAVLLFEIYIDSLGADSGGLTLYTPTVAGWLDSPSASVTLRKAKPSTDVIPATRNNHHLIQDPSELPLPIGGIHLLEEDHDYEFNGVINLGTNRLQRNGSNEIYGLNATVDTLISNNALPMVFGDDTSQISSHLTMVNVGGPIFECRNTAGNEGTNVIAFDTVFFANSPVIGTVENLKAVDIGKCFLISLNGGIIVEGLENNIINMSSNVTEPSFSGDVIALGTSVTNVLEVSGNAIEAGVGVNFMTGLPNSGNISETGQGKIVGNVSYGDNVAGLVGISPFDDRWIFDGNNTVLDTPFAGGMYMEGNTTITDVASNVGVDIPVVGVTIASIQSRFIMTGDNELTYTGKKTLIVQLSASINAKKSGGGGEQDYVFTFYLNGSPIAGASTPTEIKNRTNSSSIHAAVFLQPDDVIRLYVRSVSALENITVEGMQVVIAKL